MPELEGEGFKSKKKLQSVFERRFSFLKNKLALKNKMEEMLWKSKKKHCQRLAQTKLKETCSQLATKTAMNVSYKKVSVPPSTASSNAVNLICL